MEQEQYKAVDVCIYCGAKGDSVKLSREHTVPFSLGGTLVLPSASCEACAAITAAFEQSIARTMLGRLRILFNFPTRRPKDRPTVLPITIEVEGETSEIEIPVEDYPSFPVGFPVFRAPGLLRGLPPSDNFDGAECIPLFPAISDNDARIARIRARVGKPVDIRAVSSTPIGPFVRLLAKFAHAQAIALFGLGSFAPFLPGMILGRDQNTPHLIGGHANIDKFIAPLPPEKAHKIQFELVEIQYRDGDKVIEGTKATYLVAVIQLFQQMNSPTYAVVVGIPGKPLIEELRAATIHRQDASFELPASGVIFKTEPYQG